MENSETSTKLKDMIVMVPVSSLDFKKLNEFAEATMVCRNRKSKGNQGDEEEKNART